METIMIKVPEGTKSRLRKLNGNVSALLREQIERLLQCEVKASAHEKASHLCGVIKGGPSNMSTGKEYLKKYAPKGAH